MTPGAWKKQGFTYTLADEPPPPNEPDPIEPERRQAIDRLRIALWTFAASHEGRFPTDDEREAIPDEVWRVPDPSGMRYLYIAGQVTGPGREPLAFEPGLFDGPRLVLQANGEVVAMSPEQIDRLMAKETTP
jgi:hypothetical protein